MRYRYIDRFYYHLWRSNMTYETKNITFHAINVKVSSESQCSRTLPMNVAIESAYCGCERTLCMHWVWSKMWGKHYRIWSMVEHCIKVWYLDSRTCLEQSVHSRPLSSLVPRRCISHRNACALVTWKQWFRNGMRSNMYRCESWNPVLLKVVQQFGGSWAHPDLMLALWSHIIPFFDITMYFT